MHRLVGATRVHGLRLRIRRRVEFYQLMWTERIHAREFLAQDFDGLGHVLLSQTGFPSFRRRRHFMGKVIEAITQVVGVFRLVASADRRALS